MRFEGVRFLKLGGEGLLPLFYLELYLGVPKVLVGCCCLNTPTPTSRSSSPAVCGVGRYRWVIDLCAALAAPRRTASNALASRIFHTSVNAVRNEVKLVIVV